MAARQTGSSMPSSFEHDSSLDDSGLHKFVRKIKEEPLIPVGIGLTCFALWKASRTMGKGDHRATNRWFVARIVAQGFTVVAMTAGGLYYGADRDKRKQLQQVKAEKEAAERKQQWIRELEIRDQEERALAQKFAKKKEAKMAKMASTIQKEAVDAAAKKGAASLATVPVSGATGGTDVKGQVKPGGMFDGWFSSAVSKPQPPDSQLAPSQTQNGNKSGAT